MSCRLTAEYPPATATIYYVRWAKYGLRAAEDLLLTMRSADRRDADLMLIAQRNRFVGAIWSRGDLLNSEFDVWVRLGMVRHITGMA